MRKKTSDLKNDSAVARFIIDPINQAGTHRELAIAIGFSNSNNISMIKNGTSKLPIDKAIPLATQVEIDAVHLVRLCIDEYYPNVKAALDDVNIITRTDTEQALLDTIRESVGTMELEADTLSSLKRELSEWLENRVH